MSIYARLGARGDRQTLPPDPEVEAALRDPLGAPGTGGVVVVVAGGDPGLLVLSLPPEGAGSWGAGSWGPPEPSAGWLICR